MNLSIPGRTPEHGDVDNHLALLANVATSCGDGDFRARLSAAASLDEVRRACGAG